MARVERHGGKRRAGSRPFTSMPIDEKFGRRTGSLPRITGSDDLVLSLAQAKLGRGILRLAEIHRGFCQSQLSRRVALKSRW